MGFDPSRLRGQVLLLPSLHRSAFDQTIQARENVELAEVLRNAELRKLQAGLSNLIDVNIREVQAASSAQNLVLAQKSYFQALADYRARVMAIDG